MAEIGTAGRSSGQESKAADRPRYEPPRIEVMTERQILNTFQITQSMSGWWSTGAC